jgi:hypothetical protein
MINKRNLVRLAVMITMAALAGAFSLRSQQEGEFKPYVLKPYIRSIRSI